jgi:hypothetical protein
MSSDPVGQRGSLARYCVPARNSVTWGALITVPRAVMVASVRTRATRPSVDRAALNAAHA